MVIIFIAQLYQITLSMYAGSLSCPTDLDLESRYKCNPFFGGPLDVGI